MKREKGTSPCRQLSTARTFIKLAKRAAGAGDCTSSTLLVSFCLQELAAATRRAKVRADAGKSGCPTTAFRAAEEAAAAVATGLGACALKGRGT
jgi:hypothetical protein